MKALIQTVYICFVIVVLFNFNKLYSEIFTGNGLLIPSFYIENFSYKNEYYLNNFNKINYRKNIIDNNFTLYKQFSYPLDNFEFCFDSLSNKKKLLVSLNGSPDFISSNLKYNFKKDYFDWFFSGGYVILDKYDSFTDMNSEDYSYNIFNIKNSFKFKDNSNLLKFDTYHSYSNFDMPFSFNNTKVEIRDKTYGNYKLYLNRKLRDFSLLAEIVYYHFNQNREEYGENNINYSSDYYGFSGKLAFKSSLFNNFTAEYGINYLEDGLNNFVFFDSKIGRIDNEEIGIFFKNKYQLSENISIDANIGNSIYQRNIRDFDLILKENLPYANISMNIKNNTGNYIFQLNGNRIINSNIPDTNQKTSDVLNTSLIYNFKNNLISVDSEFGYYYFAGISEIFSNKKSNVNHLFLKSKISFINKYFDTGIIIEMNDLKKHKIFGFSYIPAYSGKLFFKDEYKFGLSWNVNLSYTGDYHTFDFIDNIYNNQKYYLINLKLGYNINNFLELKFNFNNLTDEKYYFDKYFPAPGRNIYSSIIFVL